MPLSMVQNGSRVRLVSVRGGRKLQHRLVEMGLSIGSEINVINNNQKGPFLIRIQDSRLIIGHGMAMKIEVQ